MENDLLFTIIPVSDWKKYSGSGRFNPEPLETKGFIRCYQGKQVEEAANELYPDENELYLIVIDPLRIQVPMKSEKEGKQTFLNIYGSFSIDAIIDRILLKKESDKGFAVRIKHFD